MKLFITIAFLLLPFLYQCSKFGYLVTDFKLLVHSGSLLLACFFSFDVHANGWI